MNMKLPMKKVWHPGKYEVDVELRRPTKKEIIISCIGWAGMIAAVVGVIVHKKYCQK
jgi:hypothetical protein